MSGRKNALPSYKALAAQDMSADFSSGAVDVRYLDNISIQLNCTGTPTGTFAVEGSLDETNWVALTLSPSPTVSGAAKNILLDLNQLSFPWVRVSYTASSGSGTCDVWVSGKMV